LLQKEGGRGCQKWRGGWVGPRSNLARRRNNGEPSNGGFFKTVTALVEPWPKGRGESRRSIRMGRGDLATFERGEGGVWGLRGQVVRGKKGLDRGKETGEQGGCDRLSTEQEKERQGKRGEWERKKKGKT